VAKPWLNHIYIELNSYDQSLKHELAHVLAGQFGTTPFKVAENFNPALIEGLAMALENNYNDNTLYYMADLANKNGYEFPVEQLFSGFNFFKKLSSISYIHSGAFILYLADSYGTEKVKSLYGDIDFEKYFNKSLKELVNDYNVFLDSKKFQFSNEKATLMFGRKSIFKKVCARYVANRIREARILYSEQRYKESKVEFENLLRYSESYTSLLGYTFSLIKLNENRKALDTLQNRIEKFKGTSYYYNLELVLGDLLVRNHYYSQADSIYSNVKFQNPAKNYFNAAKTKLLFSERGNSILYKYVVSIDSIKFDLLLDLNKEKFYFETINNLAELIKNNRERYNSLIKLVPLIIDDVNYSSGYAYFKLSKISILFSDFEAAKIFALNSLKYSGDESYLEICKENLQKINWFVNFSKDIKSHFAYN
jgi:hypothetical protein